MRQRGHCHAFGLLLNRVRVVPRLGDYKWCSSTAYFRWQETRKVTQYSPSRLRHGSRVVLGQWQKGAKHPFLLLSSLGCLNQRCKPVLIISCWGLILGLSYHHIPINPTCNALPAAFRGMSLPWGKWFGITFLDTAVSHVPSSSG